MYLDFWNLTHAPFSQQLDPGYFFESELHEEALARLLYVADEQKNFAAFTGPSGTGKSLTLGVFQTILKRTPHHCVNIDLFGLGEEELLWQLCAQLRLGPAYSTGLPQLWRQLTDYLTGLQLTQGRVIFLLDHFDESHFECTKSIERLLHTGNQRYSSLSIVTTLNNLKSEQATAVAHLSDLAIELAGLDQETTQSYINHRLSISGCSETVFSTDAFKEIHQATQGTPEKINQICDLALLAGYEQNLKLINADVITRAVHEIKGSPISTNRISEVVQGV